MTLKRVTTRKNSNSSGSPIERKRKRFKRAKKNDEERAKERKKRTLFLSKSWISDFIELYSKRLPEKTIGSIFPVFFSFFLLCSPISWSEYNFVFMCTCVIKHFIYFTRYISDKSNNEPTSQRKKSIHIINSCICI